MKNKKVINILKAVATFVMILAICASGVLLFHNYYYELIYVSGSSMNPTLNGAGGEAVGSVVDFGIVDTHNSAKKNIKRFSIVSTYYPDSIDYNLETNTLKKNAKKKIKRIIALPNETFKITKGKLYVLNNENNFDLVNYTFKTQPSVEEEYEGKDMGPLTLGNNEYWVLGDHRDASRDSYTINKPIKYENIHGVLVAIEGKGTLYIKEYQCTNCGKKFKSISSGLCDRCYGEIEAIYDINNKQYRWPTYY